MTEARRLLRLRRLAKVSETRITGETFEQDPAFDLQRYAERSFIAHERALCDEYDEPAYSQFRKTLWDQVG